MDGGGKRPKRHGTPAMKTDHQKNRMKDFIAKRRGGAGDLPPKKGSNMVVPLKENITLIEEDEKDFAWFMETHKPLLRLQIPATKFNDYNLFADELIILANSFRMNAKMVAAGCQKRRYAYSDVQTLVRAMNHKFSKR